MLAEISFEFPAVFYISALSDVPPSELPPPSHSRESSFIIYLSVVEDIHHDRHCILLVRPRQFSPNPPPLTFHLHKKLGNRTEESEDYQ